MKQLTIIVLIGVICAGCQNEDGTSVPSLIQKAESSVVRVMSVTLDPKQASSLRLPRGGADDFTGT